MKALVVGFGGMGCRHTQSLISTGAYTKIKVVEPDKTIFDTNLVRIGSTPDQVNYFPDLKDVNNNEYDIIIIATSSKPRFDIFSYLTSNIKCKNYLIEKVVFQSCVQFEDAIAIAEKNNLKVHCNLPNRYFRNYIDLKKTLNQSKEPFSFSVMGGDFGMACNSIHYLDLFYYLSGDCPKYSDSRITVHPNGSKRGSDYNELLGTMSFVSKNGSTFHVSADARLNDIVVVNIKTKNSDRYFFENHKYTIELKNGNSISDTFDITPSSIMTKTLVADIQEGKCFMPTLQEMYLTHKTLFSVFNKAFGLPDSKETICPIT